MEAGITQLIRILMDNVFGKLEARLKSKDLSSQTLKRDFLLKLHFGVMRPLNLLIYRRLC